MTNYILGGEELWDGIKNKNFPEVSLNAKTPWGEQLNRFIPDPISRELNRQLENNWV